MRHFPSLRPFLLSRLGHPGHRLRLVGQGLLAVAVVACGARPPAPPASDPATTESDAAAVRWEVIGRSVEMRPIRCARFGDGPAAVLFVASIHGDEAAGSPLLDELAVRLARDPALARGRSVWIVAAANPDGIARHTRHNARGVDLNRNFPASNWRGASRHGPLPLSEPESRALAELVERVRPARVLSLHQAANQLDWDGPGEELTRALGAVAPLPLARMGSRPGSLGSWLGLDLGIPIVTVELPASATGLAPEEAWELYGALLVQAIRFPERLALEATPDAGLRAAP